MTWIKTIAWFCLIAGILSGGFMLEVLKVRKQYLEKDAIKMGYVIAGICAMLVIVSYIIIFLT